MKNAGPNVANNFPPNTNQVSNHHTGCRFWFFPLNNTNLDPSPWKSNPTEKRDTICLEPIAIPFLGSPCLRI